MLRKGCAAGTAEDGATWEWECVMMKDILAVVMDAEGDAAAIAAAASMSEAANAHLACAFLTALPDEPLAYEPSVVAGVWAELLGRARAIAADERAKVEAKLKALVRPCELRTAEALGRDLGRVAAVHARYADVAVLTRPSADGRDLRQELVEGVLFHAGRPALVVPPKWTGTVGTRPMLAWDASREATRALNDAVHLFSGASTFTVVTVDAKPKAFGHSEQPGAQIAAYLARRGLGAEVRNLDSLGKSPAEALMAEAQSQGADLVVMGGYAHARVRELLFGGATRDLLEEAPVPLLMAH
jgi:nucleotide-binding universal stress UspA family protein